MIIWIEDPKKYRYLRKSTKYFSSRRFPIKSLGKNTEDFYKLIGYELIGYDKSDSWNLPFIYNYYWLKTYNDKCPDVNRCCYNDGGAPCEGIDVTELLKVNSESKRYCFECTNFYSRKNECELHKIRQYPNEPVACSVFKEYNCGNQRRTF